MLRKPRTLAQIEVDARSPDQLTRGSAVQELLLRVQKDPLLNDAALPIFRRHVATAPDAWTATTCARGIEQIEGPERARATWLALLHRPDAQLVAGVALAVTDPSYAPELFELLNSRPEPVIHKCVIRTLGRMRVSAALPIIREYLKDPATRADAIEALADFGDPAAIAHLEPLLQDTSDSGQTDDRGWPLRVGDVADEAIRRLRRSSQA
jgi:HEAT repeat protein